MMGGREERGREERRSQVQGRIIDTEAPIACGGGFFFSLSLSTPFSGITTRYCAQTHVQAQTIANTCTVHPKHAPYAGVCVYVCVLEGDLPTCSGGLENETDASLSRWQDRWRRVSF